MAEVKWIKIVTDIFDDEKILLIESLPDADFIIVIWFKLLCLAGKQNNSGVFLMNGRIPYTDKMLATIFRRNEATVKLALNTFEQFGMIEIIDNVITIPNWEKHQNIEGMERIKEQTRARVQKHRDKMKMLTDGNVTGNATVTLRNATDKIREEEIRKEEDKRRDDVFTPPTVEEVRAYCQERGNSISAERFVSYYSLNGWMVGRSPMTDWKQAIRNWEGNGIKDKQEAQPQMQAHPEWDYAELQRRAEERGLQR